MNHRLHKNVFRRWRGQNEQNGSRIGMSILDFLANEPEPHPLRDNSDPIPRVPMHTPNNQKDSQQ